MAQTNTELIIQKLSDPELLVACCINEEDNMMRLFLYYSLPQDDEQKLTDIHDIIRKNQEISHDVPLFFINPLNKDSTSLKPYILQKRNCLYIHNHNKFIEYLKIINTTKRLDGLITQFEQYLPFESYVQAFVSAIGKDQQNKSDILTEGRTHELKQVQPELPFVTDPIKHLQFLDPDQKKVVLMVTGSYNPVHKTHIRMAGWAANRCNTDQVFSGTDGEVVSVVFSPSSNKHYLDGKMKKVGTPNASISGEHRLNMIQLSINEYQRENPISVKMFTDNWEMNQEKFEDFPNVVKSLQERINSTGILNCKVIYLCGADHYQHRQDGINYVVIKRHGYNMTKQPNDYMYDTPANGDYNAEASSSMVRTAIEQKNYDLLKNLLYKNVIRYMIENNIINQLNGPDVQQAFKENESQFQKKYLKYKNKYLQLKQMLNL